MAPPPPGLGVLGGNAAQVRTFDLATAALRPQLFIEART